jgi:hypothetical protein
MQLSAGTNASGKGCQTPIETGRKGEGGFALLTVLLTLVAMTALAAAGFALSDSDYRVSQNHRSSLQAFLASNAGLYDYMGTVYNGDTLRTYGFPTGDVTAAGRKLIDIGDGRVVYEVAARASYDAPEGGTATRTVSTLAIYSDGDIDALAAISALPGLDKDGGSGTISGYDSADEDDCELAVAAPIPGVLVPPGGYTQNGGSPVPEGNPAQKELEESALIDYIDIPWQEISSGQGLYPDVRIPGDAWPDFNQLPSESWPLVFVDGSSALNATDSGRGTLIVTGDLTMSGSFSWDGLILVGGVMTSNGNNNVQGAVLTGLDVLLGEDVAETHIAHGTKTFQYNSCNVLRASEQGFGGLHEVPGTWSERL